MEGFMGIILLLGIAGVILSLAMKKKDNFIGKNSRIILIVSVVLIVVCCVVAAVTAPKESKDKSSADSSQPVSSALQSEASPQSGVSSAVSSDPSSAQVTSATAPSAPVVSTIPDLDWEKLAADFKADASVSGEDFFVDAFAKCEGDTITITAVVNAATNDETVLEYADTIVRRLGALASQHNAEYSLPGSESFGGVYDYYNLMIGIAPAGSEGNQDEWYIFDAIAKGVQTKHEFKITRK